MTLILSIWTVSLMLVILIYIAAVRGWRINLFLMLGAIIDALKDVACQAWIDVEKIWKREKEVKLDESESFYHE